MLRVFAVMGVLWRKSSVSWKECPQDVHSMSCDQQTGIGEQSCRPPDALQAYPVHGVPGDHSQCLDKDGHRKEGNRQEGKDKSTSTNNKYSTKRTRGREWYKERSKI